MDPADLNEVPERDSKTQGLNLSPRLNFVPPPEAPAPETATIQSRALALGIDALIGLGVFILLSIIYGGVSSSNGLFRIKIGGPPLLMATVLWIVYMTWMEGKNGDTIGKRARGLRVVMEDGEPVHPEAALTRNLMRFLDAFPYVVPYVVGAYAISNSPKMQRFGDRVAETMVVISSSKSTDPAALPPPLLPIGSGPGPAPSTRRKRGLRSVAVLALLVVLVVGAAAALFLMRGGS
ncbi:MAG TPA: RDD family protein [Acidimicrobiia bacterium]|jgi:uncharacterized RDD family membrane protein YckC|nr:RDD family protein [Acidimicrobiia bacterium]